jgi:hypothetical protein
VLSYRALADGMIIDDVLVDLSASTGRLATEPHHPAVRSAGPVAPSSSVPAALPPTPPTYIAETA